ncbi:S41 family peptidase [Chryseobacterium tructae]|uniref:S41 family peptidase n=1 Tax=Chryseobacterium tructae TaxID=1037380 RepID=A0ABV7XSS0_9FLAO
MKIKLVLILIMFSYGIGNAQSVCGCKDALQKIISKIETEYPGFELKTKDKILYEAVKNKAMTSAENVKNDEDCLEILKDYTGFFKDRHIWVLPNQTNQQKVSNNVALKPLKVNLEKFKRDIQKSKDGFEGIWENDSYEVGIKKINEKEYAGFIIKADPAYWKANEIKFKLFSDGSYEYYLPDHSIQKGTYKMEGNSLLYFNELRSFFIKKNPQSTMSPEEIENKKDEINEIFIKKISPKTVMIRLKYFSYSFVDQIEKLIEKNRGILEGAAFWIIDVRGNGGGTDDAYRSLLPYITTNPVRNVGAEYLASTTLIQTSENYLKGISKDSIKNREDIKDLKARIALLKKNQGKYVNYSTDKVTVSSIPHADKSPAQIVVLADNKTGSAAENFLLKAKQSKKVKIMGIPSSGVLDYANAMFFDYGCNNFKLLMPTYRSFRLPVYPIDNIGIQPDVYLDETVEDWITFAKEYLEN